MISENNDLKKFNNKNYIFTIVGAIIGLGGFIFAIYTFLYDPKPNVEFSVLSRINVLDINTKISSLDVLLDSISLKKSNENIKIYTIRVINTGDADITTERFDETAPLGIHVDNGYLLEKPELIASSNDYLSKIANNIHFTNRNDFTIPPFILDKSEFFDLKFSVVHFNDSIPTLRPLGKVSGQKNIEINEDIKSVDDAPLLKKAFSGTTGIQFIRLVIYLFIWIAIVMAIAGISSLINSHITKQKRARAIRQFKEINKIRKNEEFIMTIYKDHGFRKIYQYHSILKSSVESLERQKNSKKYRSSGFLITELIESGIILEDTGNGRLSVESKLKGIIDNLYEFLKENNFREGYPSALIEETEDDAEDSSAGEE